MKLYLIVFVIAVILVLAQGQEDSDRAEPEQLAPTAAPPPKERGEERDFGPPASPAPTETTPAPSPLAAPAPVQPMPPPMPPGDEAPANVYVRIDIVGSTGNFRFSPENFTVKSGQSVVLTFTNSSSGRTRFPHEWILVRPGKAEEVLAYGANAGMDSGDPLYTPYVYANTRTVEPGRSTTISFIAPDRPGAYPFVSFTASDEEPLFGEMRVEPLG